MSPTDWVAEVREAGPVAVGEAFGALRTMRAGAPRQGLTPCPACKAENRTTAHHQDNRRGPVGLSPDGLGWVCHVCGAKGDAVTLACVLAGQGAKLTGGNAREVRQACERVGLVTPEGATPRAPRPKPAPFVPSYPPKSELVQLFMHQAVALADACDTELDLLLALRKLDKTKLAAADVVRFLPRGATVPAWATKGGKPWSNTPYRLLAPLWTAAGEWVSVHARAVTETDPKSANPYEPTTGYQVGGLVLACPLAQGMLYGREGATEHVRRNGLVIAEGLPDWLTVIAQEHGKPEAMAVVGIVSGSWTQEHADKVPTNCRVLIATDKDNGGDKYAEKIAQTLAKRARAGLLNLRRWNPKEVLP